VSKSAPISIIIPVLREEDGIDGLIAHLHAVAGGSEIIVVDGDPARSTIGVVTDRTVVTAASAPGRAIQMNHGASLATGGVLLFLHADTFLPENALSLIREAMADPRVVAGAFDLGIDSRRKIFRVTERYVAGDQALFIRRDYFHQIGGYRDIPVMEDVELMRRIKKRGGGVRIIPQKVMTSPRRWEQEGVLYATLRNWMLQFLYFFGVSPARLARFYRKG
jgi:rSAM/selenodomain-associated transferase 2